MSDPDPTQVSSPPKKSRWQFFVTGKLWHHIRRDKAFLLSALVFAFLILGSFFAPIFAPSDPYDLASIDIMNSEMPPSWTEEGSREFLLGTDNQGRDLLSTILYGLRISLIISIAAVLLQSILGIVLGLIAGYYGGIIDAFIMRLADIQLSLSTLMLAIISLAIVKTFFPIELYEQIVVYMIILVIGFSEWPQYARTVRAGVLSEKKKEYIEAAEVIGFSKLTIIFKQVMPNIISPVFVISSIQVANAIISETSLSFLGLGIPPTQPSIGMLIHNGFDYILSGAWWISIIPSMVLIILVLSINNIGDWLRDYLNPKLYKD